MYIIKNTMTTSTPARYKKARNVLSKNQLNLLTYSKISNVGTHLKFDLNFVDLQTLLAWQSPDYNKRQ